MTDETVSIWGNSTVLPSWKKYYEYNTTNFNVSSLNKQTPIKEQLKYYDIENQLNKEECDYTYEDFCNANKEWCVQNGLTYKQQPLMNDCIDGETIVYQPKQKLNDCLDGETIVYQPKQKLNDCLDGETIVYQPKQKLNDCLDGETIVYQPKQKLNDCLDGENIVYQPKQKLNDCLDDGETIVYQPKQLLYYSDKHVYNNLHSYVQFV
jgi:RNase P/RNase MRP subunit p29